MAIGIKGATKLLSLGIFLTWKIFVEVGGTVDGNIAAILVVRLLEAHVMVSQAQAIGHLAVQDRHGFLGNGPFLRGIRLHDVPLVDEEGNIEPLPVVMYTAGLLEKVASQIPVSPLLG